MERDRGTQGETPNPVPGNSQEMQSRTENRREQKERNRELVPNPATPDHSVASYDTHGSHGEPNLLTPYHYPPYIISTIDPKNQKIKEENGEKPTEMWFTKTSDTSRMF